ncbi:MAG: hypothetical protein AB1652_00765 [Bacillota bacterium]
MQKIIEPPAGYEPRQLNKGMAWCPYCGKESLFGHDSRLNNARCMECGISERDFYIRRFNRLWNDKTMDAFVAGAVKSGRKWNKPYPWEKGKEIPREEAGLLKKRVVYCDSCKREFTATSNRRKYCENCATEIRRQKLAEYKRKERKQKTKPKAS